MAPIAAIPDDTLDNGTSTLQAFLSSVAVIFATEIGDKTFLIAAVMAMRHPRTTIFLGAILALFIMSALSAVIGHALPALIPRSYVDLLGAVLFLVFGARMIHESGGLSDDAIKEELDEVTAELDDKKFDDDEEAQMQKRHEEDEGFELKVRKSESASGAVDSARASLDRFTISTPPDHDAVDTTPSSAPAPAVKADECSLLGCLSAMGSRLSSTLSTMTSPAFIQTFILVFLAEWGDRSQIATIALAATQGVVVVTLSTTFGHSLCTGLAVVGGRLLASRISIKKVTLIGGIVFMLFGLFGLYELGALSSAANAVASYGAKGGDAAHAAVAAAAAAAGQGHHGLANAPVPTPTADPRTVDNAVADLLNTKTA
ncbi:UPF0016-domain-containing protein [Ramicandelaber brevisporus]|nr:UPF0016-domain-containing protein [Ramicandelaber brevisporus]